MPLWTFGSVWGWQLLGEASLLASGGQRPEMLRCLLQRASLHHTYPALSAGEAGSGCYTDGRALFPSFILAILEPKTFLSGHSLCFMNGPRSQWTAGLFCTSSLFCPLSGQCLHTAYPASVLTWVVKLLNFPLACVAPLMFCLPGGMFLDAR